MDGGVNDNAIFDFNTDYFATMNYEFIVPLAFGNDFRIVIQDTMTFKDSIIGEMVSGNKIGLAIRNVNDFPLDLTLTVIPIDKDNKPLAGVTAEPLTIKAGSKMTDNPADLIFDDKNSNQLINMRGVVYQIEARTGENKSGIPLRPDNFIQLRLTAKIEGGVTVDLRDFLNRNDNDNDNDE